ncbi:uncharacterized protein LOC143604756 [Bidens hawaiensis]|uniref:uncharacterized protein LOC143604756 n=1 Tax=Bidens hawaiensis TaxID=980011 RepID=UPI00404B5D62
MTLAGFDIVLDMGWLSDNQARILCDKKAIKICATNGKSIQIAGDKDAGHVSLISMIKANKYLIEEVKKAQKKAIEENQISEEKRNGTIDSLVKGDDDILRLGNRIWVPNVDELREKIMSEAHHSKHMMHPGSDKMYQNLKLDYWWNGMKKDIALYIAKCLTCLQIKAEHQKPSGSSISREFVAIFRSMVMLKGGLGSRYKNYIAD